VSQPADPDVPDVVPADAVGRVLTEGALEISARIMPASTAAFYAEAVLDRLRVPCVYKPVAGERPLWDFPDGTLAAREVAAHLVSEALGWDVVPLTLLRDGPAGPGMVQLWCEPDPVVEAIDVRPPGLLPPGWLHVLDATDGGGRPVSLVHEDSPALRRMAVFDVLVNNADRKGGHVLAMSDGHRYGVDHGICFHQENKLRTVLWGWAQERLDPADREAVERLRELLESDSALRGRLEELLTGAEVEAFERRVRRLLAKGRMPLPSGSWPAIPWPAF
jgi:uncharacterized repeat protein (TIGR03843 family)